VPADTRPGGERDLRKPLPDAQQSNDAAELIRTHP
jgi:hypothetical protein